MSQSGRTLPHIFLSSVFAIIHEHVGSWVDESWCCFPVLGHRTCPPGLLSFMVSGPSSFHCGRYPLENQILDPCLLLSVPLLCRLLSLVAVHFCRDAVHMKGGLYQPGGEKGKWVRTPKLRRCCYNLSALLFSLEPATGFAVPLCSPLHTCSQHYCACSISEHIGVGARWLSMPYACIIKWGKTRGGHGVLLHNWGKGEK